MKRMGSPFLPLYPVLAVMALAGAKLLWEANRVVDPDPDAMAGVLSDRDAKALSAGPPSSRTTVPRTAGSANHSPASPGASVPWLDPDRSIQSAHAGQSGVGHRDAEAGSAQEDGAPPSDPVGIHSWAVALSRHGDVAAVELALDQTADGPARRMLVRMLAAASGEDLAWVRMLERLAASDHDAPTRLAAVTALGERPGEAATIALAALARDSGAPTPAPRAEAVRLLAQRTEPAAIAALAELAERPPAVASSDPDTAAARSAAVDSLAQIALSAGRDRTANLRASPESVTAAVDVLGRVLRREAPVELHGHIVQTLRTNAHDAPLPGALEMLVATLRDRHAPLTARHLTLLALRDRQEPAARSALEEIARSESPGRLRDAAREALGLPAAPLSPAAAPALFPAAPLHAASPPAPPASALRTPQAADPAAPPADR